MSTYECSITNPKKQLEFYKQLSEQLQQENQQLKEEIKATKEVAGEHLKKEIQLKSVIKEIREYIQKNKLYTYKYDEEELFEITTDEVAKTDLLQILDKVKD